MKRMLKQAKPDHAKRRTSVNPPSIEEALLAASGLTSDRDQMVELASSLIGLPRQEIEPAAARLGRGAVRTINTSRRTVIVERKTRA